MNPAFIIALHDIRHQMRQGATLLWVFVMPPIFFYIIGTVTGGFAGGSGGEATTWLAKDRLTRAEVALKIVPAKGGARSRLHDEWQINLRLMHAHIVRVFEFHEDQGVAFYSMQFVDGADLGVLTGSPLAARIAATASATDCGLAMRQAPKLPRWTRSLGQPTFRLISS